MAALFDVRYNTRGCKEPLAQPSSISFWNAKLNSAFHNSSSSANLHTDN